MQLPPAPHAAHAHPASDQPSARTFSGWVRRRTRSRSYLQGYATRRRAPRFRIR